MRALVIGEALIDVVERDGTVLGEHVGGSPLNVAVGLGRLGRGVDFLTHLGDDDAGRRIIGYLDAAGVTVVEGSGGARRTARAVARLDRAGAATYEFDLDWRLSGTPPVRPPLLVHTGSIGAFLAPGCRAVSALVDAYRGASTVSYDPNARPALVEDRAEVIGRISTLIEKADVVKTSDEDLHWIDPTRSPETLAAAWLRTGPAMVVVTTGERGSFAVCATGTVSVPAPPVEVVDTVGAGDAYMVGLLDALWSRDLLGADRRSALHAIDRDGLAGVLTEATRVATLTVARAGADLPDRAALRNG